MSDITFKFSWWVYFFIPPILLADALRWWTVPLAVAVAVLWLTFWRRGLDAVLLGIAVVATIVFAWAVVPAESCQLLAGGCAIFVWLAVLLVPVRWIVHRLTARRA